MAAAAVATAMGDVTNRAPHMSPHQAKAVGEQQQTKAEQQQLPSQKAEQQQPPGSREKASQLPASRQAASEDDDALAALQQLNGGGAAAQDSSLQEGFAAFRAKRAKQIARKRAEKEKAQAQAELRRKTDPEFQAELRRKFVEGCRGYLGLPYSKRVALKLCEEGDPDLDAELYLDCCGLVRRVLRDLAEDFGFTIGPWNQAYQWETLPILLKGPEEMEPGDLIFTSGSYFDKNRKRQRHGMTHVEVFIGGETGEATIGSRKVEMIPLGDPRYDELDTGGLATGDATKLGHVSEHPTYKFRSLAYSSDTYYFCSIKPWLEGDCRPRHTEWVGQLHGEWIKETKEGRECNAKGRSLFNVDESGADECSDECD